MDINQIEAMYKKLTAIVGTRMTPHRFRHTLASDLMRQADRNIHVAKALLNHSSIATTMEYIETDPHQMRHVLEERADKVPRNLIARVDYSARQHQEQRLDLPKPPPSLPSQQPWSISGPSTPEAFDQLAEWISNGARPLTAVGRRG